MSVQRPAEVVAPGGFLHEELIARGWLLTDLALRMGCSLPLVEELIAGKSAIDSAMAERLAAALGTSVELWLNLAAVYRSGSL